MTLLFRLVVLVGVLALYYRVGKGALFGAAQRLAPRLSASRGLDSSEVAGVLELAAAAASHLLLVVTLLLLTGLPPSHLAYGLGNPGVLVLGVLLGAGLVGLSSLVCRVVIEAASLAGRVPVSAPGAILRPRARVETAERVTSWLGRSRGGWIRHHLRTLQVVPLPAAVALTGVQVSCEEIVFRAIALEWLRPYGAVVAIGCSFALFTIMQVFFMSGWRAALFPVVGALVMGLAHSILFWNYPVVAPLVISHVTFFFFAVL